MASKLNYTTQLGLFNLYTVFPDDLVNSENSEKSGVGSFESVINLSDLIRGDGKNKFLKTLLRTLG